MRLKLCWFMFGGGWYVGKCSEVNIFLIYHVSSGSGASFSGVKLVLFPIFVTHSAVNAITPNRLYPKNNLNRDRQKGKADHVSQPSFS